jgi:hypothetical protein
MCQPVQTLGAWFLNEIAASWVICHFFLKMHLLLSGWLNFFTPFSRCLVWTRISSLMLVFYMYLRWLLNKVNIWPNASIGGANAKLSQRVLSVWEEKGGICFVPLCKKNTILITYMHAYTICICIHTHTYTMHISNLFYIHLFKDNWP